MPPVTQAGDLRIASETDIGMRRTGNEDAHAVGAPGTAAALARDGVLLVVADGMGGANAGEIASRIAVDVVVRAFHEGRGDPPDAVLRAAIEAANAAILAQAATRADQRGMGTTCTALVVRGGELWLGHVGDSRAYLVREGRAIRLTRDHSLVAELVARGHLTEEEARHDPRRNVVTRSVGAVELVQVDAVRLDDELRRGEAVVLCSDGLHGLVGDDEIARWAWELEPEDACVRLVETANGRGGPDNVTVIVARRAPAPRGWAGMAGRFARLLRRRRA